MISDETFPIEFDDIDIAQTSIETTINTNATRDVSSLASTIEWTRPAASTSCEQTASVEDSLDETTATNSFMSLNASKIASIPSILPRAPSKKRISFSCQDLLTQPKRHSYDHVQSKVKKIIEENASRRKVISRHKSMIISTQQSDYDEAFYEDSNRDDLLQELKQKSLRIVELVEKCEEKDARLSSLEEKCDEKDSRIYALEYDRSKMRMTFDKLRLEMHELKEKEEQYKLQLAMSSPPSRYLRHAITQTQSDDDIKVINSNPVVRELTFTVEQNATLDRTHFSELNNASSDNLIPAPDFEIPLDDIEPLTASKSDENQDCDDDDSDKKKKKKKFRRLFSIISCVSKNGI